MQIKIIAVIGVLLFVAFFSYRAGVDHEQAKDAKAIIKYQKRVSDLLNDLEAEKQKQKVITREKIITIKEAADPSGCADMLVPDSIVKQL